MLKRNKLLEKSAVKCYDNNVGLLARSRKRKDITMQKLIRAIVNVFPKPIRDLYYKYEEKWLYLFFGVLTTAVSFISAGIAKNLLESAGMGKDAVSNLSTFISWICAVTFAYVTNRLWVFESKAKGAKEITAEAASFYGGRVFTLLAEMAIMWLGYSLIGINYWVTKIAANVIVLILNYVISKLFVFKDKTGSKPAESTND